MTLVTQRLNVVSNPPAAQKPWWGARCNDRLS
jgi:hypothetical protein